MKNNGIQEDLERGKVGEDIAGTWLQGVDFHHLQKVIHLTPYHSKEEDKNGVLSPAYRHAQEEAQGVVFPIWTYINGYNKNRDYIVTYRDGTKERHEVKAQYAAHKKSKNTQNIAIEVAREAVLNFSDVYRQCKAAGIHMEIRGGDGWYNPKPGGFADWYHHFVPMWDWRHGEKTDKNYELEITPAEVEAFRADKRIPPNSGIICGVPVNRVVSMTGEKTRYYLEKYAGMQFDEGAQPPAIQEKIIVYLPIKTIVRDIIKDRAQGSAQAALISVCDYEKNSGAADALPDRLYITEGMRAHMVHHYKNIGEALRELDRRSRDTGLTRDRRQALEAVKRAVKSLRNCDVERWSGVYLPGEWWGGMQYWDVYKRCFCQPCPELEELYSIPIYKPGR